MLKVVELVLSPSRDLGDHIENPLHEAARIFASMLLYAAQSQISAACCRTALMDCAEVALVKERRIRHMGPYVSHGRALLTRKLLEPNAVTCAC